MQTIDWDKLTDEQKDELLQRAEAERRQRLEQREAERRRYKEMAEASVDEIFQELEKASCYLAELKLKAYNTLNTLVDIKKEIYNTTRDNKSHTFTNAATTRSITIGSHEVSSWDGTEVEGIELVNQYLAEKVADDELKAILAELLKRDKNGNLDARRAMSLAKLKEKVADPKFREGVDIILAAYKPARTALFVEAKERKGIAQRWKALPLSFAAVETATD